MADRPVNEERCSAGTHRADAEKHSNRLRIGKSVGKIGKKSGPVWETKNPRSGPVRGRNGGRRKVPAITYSRAGRTTIGPWCLTAVFGMGTGVATRVRSPAWIEVVESYNECVREVGCPIRAKGRDDVAKRSAVSTGRLSTLLHLHPRPIDPVVSREPSCKET
jgi:hypothetical protein